MRMIQLYRLKINDLCLSTIVQRAKIHTTFTRTDFQLKISFSLYLYEMEHHEWFSSWFDTEFYHTLYGHRDTAEAEQFIANLVQFLSLDKALPVLDLACGKGRHSITLHSLGYKVVGADLSPNSIEYAKRFEDKNLKFMVHDMREPIEGMEFQAVFNLFTSFGYFDRREENLKVLHSINKMLRTEGVLVIDFMNVVKVVNHLVPEEIQSVGGIDFTIKRSFDGSHIFKYIQLTTEGKTHSYMEKVQGLTFSDYQQLFSESDFELIRTFGDFDLSPFDENTSNRLILIAQKK